MDRDQAGAETAAAARLEDSALFFIVTCGRPPPSQPRIKSLNKRIIYVSCHRSFSRKIFSGLAVDLLKFFILLCYTWTALFFIVNLATRDA